MEDKLAYFKSHRNENLVHIKDRLTEKKSRRKKWEILFYKEIQDGENT